MSKLYIAVLDDFPDYMTPTLVGHTVLGAHMKFSEDPVYQEWLKEDFRKVVVRVNMKEFNKIKALEKVYVGHEKHTIGGIDSCVVVCPYAENETIPNVLKFAKLWQPLCDFREFQEDSNQ